MPVPIPRWRVPAAPDSLAGENVLGPWSWRDLPRLPPLVLADGSGPAAQPTAVRVCADQEALAVRFDCTDRDAWATLCHRDDPIYTEEAVELFLAPGGEDPVRYFEFEVSPAGVLFDARIANPTGQRADLVADVAWDCSGVRWAAGRGERDEDWWAVLVLPWSSISPPGQRPAVWRANFYRIERPRDGEAEFSAWSPPLTSPADFHQPARFGVLQAGAASL